MISLYAASRSVGCSSGGTDVLLPFFLLSESGVVYVWVGNKILPCERSS